MVTRSTPGYPVALLIAAALTLAVLMLASPADGRGGDDTLFDVTTTVDELFGNARDAFGLQRYGLAVKYYEEILRRDRTNLHAVLELSNVYERTGKLEYARGLLIRATRIDPTYPAIEERRISIDRLLVAILTAEIDSLLGHGDYETAIPKLSLHLTIDPDNASVHYKRALCLFEMGRFDAAAANIEAAVAISPQEPYFVLRDRINGEKRRGEVKQLATQASRLAKSDNPRNREQTLKLLGQILDIDPDHTWAQNEFLRLSEVEEAGEPDVAATEDPAPGTFRLALHALVGAVLVLSSFMGRHLSAILILTAVVLVFRSPLTTIISSRVGRQPLLSGDLDRFSVAEVLTMLNAEPQTGVLTIRATTCRGKVFFDEGEPCHSTSGKLEGTDALMWLVNNAQRGRFVFTAGTIPLQHTIDAPLSLLLVEQAHKTNGVAVVEKKSKMKELLDSKLGV